MKVCSTFRPLALLIALLIFSSHSVFGRGPLPTKPEVKRKQSAVLLIGDHEGIDETDAQNAALLVTEALRERGIVIIDPVHEAPAGATVYRVVLRGSDEKILFRLSQEDSTGTLLAEREMLLADVKKIASAVPRLVYAFVHREPISSSQMLGNVSVFTAAAPGKELSAPGRGVGIGLSIDRLSYAVDVGFQIAWLGTLNESFNFRLGSLGGRYFFSNKQDISPYVGGGIAAMFVTKTGRTRQSGFFGSYWDYDEHPEEDFGIGAYGALGVEVGRYTQYRFKFELRVDRPFFRLPSQDVMPITLGIVGGFSF